jgi:acetoin utilization protein AcuA
MVTISSFCSPHEIESLFFEDAHTKHARYKPIVSEKETLIKAASQQDNNVTLAFTTDGRIIGLGILEYPPPESRWTRVGDRIMMEVSVIQVSRSWRGKGISKEILRTLVDHPLREDRIFYMLGYTWTWDLDGKGMAAAAYRDILIRLFTERGFTIFQTNEPNVMLRTENLFMARIGARISVDIKRQFKMVRYNLSLHV